MQMHPSFNQARVSSFTRTFRASSCPFNKTINPFDLPTTMFLFLWSWLFIRNDFAFILLSHLGLFSLTYFLILVMSILKYDSLKVFPWFYFLISTSKTSHWPLKISRQSAPQRFSASFSTFPSQAKFLLYFSKKTPNENLCENELILNIIRKIHC